MILVKHMFYVARTGLDVLIVRGDPRLSRDIAWQATDRWASCLPDSTPSLFCKLTPACRTPKLRTIKRFCIFPLVDQAAYLTLVAVDSYPPPGHTQAPVRMLPSSLNLPL